MEIRITKGQGDDGILILRDDGSRASTRFAHKGPVPHDAVHLFVERELGLGLAFWGQVASGKHPEEIAVMAKAGGHASASRAELPAAGIVEMIQAERLVECFEADLWGGGGADEDVLAMAEAGCAASNVPMLDLDQAAIGRIRDQIAQFAAEWRQVPIGHIVSFQWSMIAA